ncbi:unnamed protein product [Amoebophrya sp. A25]|nr:unnamed protein product [Amoebophrya sp. A25]|eukprot:GSA25T00010043001.1
MIPRRRNRLRGSWYGLCKEYVTSFFGFLNLSYMIALFAIMFQSFALNVVFFQFYITEDGTIPLFVVEVIQIAYMLFNYQIEHSARLGAVIWISYSWLMAGKFLVIYLKVLPHVDVIAQSADSYSWIRTPATLSVSLYLVAVVYIALMFRAQKSLFGHLNSVPTPDVILHQDMVWHVALDAVDIVNMTKMSRLQDFLETDIVLEYWSALNLFRRVSPIFIFLAMLAHSQSFPRAEWKFARRRLDKNTIQAVNEAVIGSEAMARAQKKSEEVQRQNSIKRRGSNRGGSVPRKTSLVKYDGLNHDTNASDRELQINVDYAAQAEHLQRPKEGMHSASNSTTTDDEAGGHDVDALSSSTASSRSGRRSSPTSSSSPRRGRSRSRPPPPAFTIGPGGVMIGNAPATSSSGRGFSRARRRENSLSGTPSISSSSDLHEDSRIGGPPSRTRRRRRRKPPDDPRLQEDDIIDHKLVLVPRKLRRSRPHALPVRSSGSLLNSASSSHSFATTGEHWAANLVDLANPLDRFDADQESLPFTSADESEVGRHQEPSPATVAAVETGSRLGTQASTSSKTSSTGTATGSRTRINQPGNIEQHQAHFITIPDSPPSLGEEASSMGGRRRGRSPSHSSTGEPPPGGGRSSTSNARLEGQEQGPAPPSGTSNGRAVTTPFYTYNQASSYANIGAEFHLRTQLDVVSARERSATISLFLVDLPFGLLRVFLFLVTLRSPQPVWPPLAMKNISCLFLNMVQLRMIEQRRGELIEMLHETNECAEEYRIHRARLWHRETREDRLLEEQLAATDLWSVRSITLGVLRVLWNTTGGRILRRRRLRRKKKYQEEDERERKRAQEHLQGVRQVVDSARSFTAETTRDSTDTTHSADIKDAAERATNNYNSQYSSTDHDHEEHPNCSRETTLHVHDAGGAAARSVDLSPPGAGGLGLSADDVAIRIDDAARATERVRHVTLSPLATKELQRMQGNGKLSRPASKLTIVSDLPCEGDDVFDESLSSSSTSSIIDDEDDVFSDSRGLRTFSTLKMSRRDSSIFKRGRGSSGRTLRTRRDSSFRTKDSNIREQDSNILKGQEYDEYDDKMSNAGETVTTFATNATSSLQPEDDYDDNISSVLSSRLEAEFTSRRDQHREQLLLTVMEQTRVEVKLRRNSGLPNFCLVFLIGFFLGALIAFRGAIFSVFQGDESVGEVFQDVDISVLWGSGDAVTTAVPKSGTASASSTTDTTTAPSSSSSAESIFDSLLPR